MTKQHTPGPWTIAEEVDSAGNKHVYIVGDYYVAETLETYDGRSKITTALIAAAPEMYFAIKTFLTAHEVSCKREDCHEVGIDFMLQAIAKAEGKEDK